MAGLFFLDALRRRLRASRLQKKISQAQSWSKAEAEINRWSVIPAEDDVQSFSSGYQIEAGFHFMHNGEYCGGYVRSAPMAHTAAEKLASGNPRVTIRYNPADPNETVVLAEDNAGKLTFEVLSG